MFSHWCVSDIALTETSQREACAAHSSIQVFVRLWTYKPYGTSSQWRAKWNTYAKFLFFFWTQCLSASVWGGRFTPAGAGKLKSWRVNMLPALSHCGTFTQPYRKPLRHQVNRDSLWSIWRNFHIKTWSLVCIYVAILYLINAARWLKCSFQLITGV